MARARQNHIIPGDDMPADFDLRRDLFDFDFDGVSTVEAIDVGQGNATAIRDNDGTIVMFHDYGGLGDRPADIDLRLDVEVEGDDGLLGHAAILLSHWDLDHFCTARVVPEARTHSRWLAPRQRVGGQAVDFANLLTPDADAPAANVCLWGYNHDIVEWDLGDGCSARLERCTGHIPEGPLAEEERNHSGLALTLISAKETAVEADDDAMAVTEILRYTVVLPGDAPYRYVQSLAPVHREDDMRCLGLIAYHHGAHSHWNEACADAVNWLAQSGEEPLLILSYGANNNYGHPSLANYRDNNWPNEIHCATPALREDDGGGPYTRWRIPL